MQKPSPENQQYSDQGYEKRDVSVVTTLIVMGGIVMTIVACLIFVDDLFTSTKEKMMYEYALHPESPTLQRLRAHEDSILTSYGKGDTLKGTYRIPIAKAMELVASEASHTQSAESSSGATAK